jgi:hypothetical protein
MKRLTDNQAARAAAWLQNTLSLQDWNIELFLSEEPPEWVSRDGVEGCCDVAHQDKYARLWVHPKPQPSVYLGDVDPLHTLCHEFLHVLAVDVGWENTYETTTRDGEQCHNRMGAVLVAAYRAGVKI